MANKVMKPCPRCIGTGKSGMVLVHTNKQLTYAEAERLQAEVSRCDLCAGIGTVPPETFAWMQVGEMWRQARLAIGLGLREWAELIGAIPSVYAGMESGRIEPDPRFNPMPEVKKEIGKCREYILENEARIDTVREPLQKLQAELARAIRERDGLGNDLCNAVLLATVAADDGVNFHPPIGNLSDYIEIRWRCADNCEWQEFPCEYITVNNWSYPVFTPEIIAALEGALLPWDGESTPPTQQENPVPVSDTAST